MRQFTIAAATVAIAALISAAPALADHNGGGPIKQNGQCWKASRGSRSATRSGTTSDDRGSNRGSESRWGRHVLTGLFYLPIEQSGKCGMARTGFCSPQFPVRVQRPQHGGIPKRTGLRAPT